MGSFRLYESPPSGNCYKVRLLLAHLGIPYERVPFDLAKGEARTEAFRARFPLGRVPVLELPTGELLAESNAQLCYLAEGTPYLPSDRWQRAQVLQWLFWEQYSHEPYVAVPRAWLLFFGIPPGKEAELAERQAKGRAALELLDRHLRDRQWLVGDRMTVADIALYGYSHVAEDGQLSLQPYPSLRAWIARVAAQPGHRPLSD